MTEGLTEAERWRLYIEEVKASGDFGSCPCCGQTVKVYPRTVNRSMIGVLAFLARYGAKTTADLPVTMARSREHPKLSYWGLVRLDELGQWAVTERGYAFLRGAPIEKYAYVYNGAVLRRSEDTVTIGRINHGFDLSDLLNPDRVAEMA